MKIFDLIVGKDLAYAAKQGGGTISGYNEADLLDVGALALFTENGVLVDLVTPANIPAQLVGVRQVYWAVGRTNDVLFSQRIDRDCQHRVKCAYIAPVNQVTTVTSFGFPVTITAGMELELSVSIAQEGQEPMVTKDRHNVTAVTGDTATTLLNKLVAKINANSNYVTAAVTVPGVTITLTSINKNVTFTVGVNGIIENAVATVTTPAVFSQGDGDDVAKLIEEYSRVLKGQSSLVKYTNEMFSQPKEVDVNETYSQYIWKWQQEARSSLNTQPTNFKGVHLILPDGATVEGLLDTAFAAIFGQVGTTTNGSGLYTGL